MARQPQEPSGRPTSKLIQDDLPDDESELTANLGLNGVAYLYTRYPEAAEGVLDLEPSPPCVSDDDDEEVTIGGDSNAAIRGERTAKPDADKAIEELKALLYGKDEQQDQVSTDATYGVTLESPAPYSSVAAQKPTPIPAPQEENDERPPSHTPHRKKNTVTVDIATLSKEQDDMLELELEDIALTGRSALIGATDIENGTTASPDPPFEDDTEKSFASLANSPRFNKEYKKRLTYLVASAAALVLLSCLLIFAMVKSRSRPHVKEGRLNEQQQSIHDIIEQALENVDVLSDPKTPQYKARKWILSSDEDIKSVSKDQVLQRFSLASLYYSTDGENSWKENNWLQGDECEHSNNWDGLGCNGDGQVRAIVLDDFGLSGSIPDEIGHILSLQNLIVKNNPDLRGSIPTTLGHLGRSLKQLGLYRNALSGTIPDIFSHTKELRFINLEGNNLWGGIPLSVEHLFKLDTLVLSENNLEGVIPMDQLAKTSVKYLGLSHNSLSSFVERSIQDIGTLEHLYLDDNKLRGTIPDTLGQLTNLKSLDFGNNQFTGTIPTSVGFLRKLEFLSMNANKLSGSLPKELGLLTNMVQMNFATNELSGRIPNVANMIALVNLQLFENKLSGSIPEAIQQLQSIEILFLSSNQLTGTIPRTISQLSRTLQGLYLSDNNFQGRIPSELCAFNSLKALFLDSNALWGQIPSCVGGMTDLHQMYLFGNALTGQVPSSVQDLRELNGLGVEDNKLSGEMPEEVCDLVEEAGTEIWADCTDQFGTDVLLCSCCTVCCPGADCQ